MVGKLDMEARPYSYHLIKSESGMRLVLLVAPSGEGKTTACLKVVERVSSKKEGVGETKNDKH